jgi:hypothetical protein
MIKIKKLSVVCIIVLNAAITTTAGLVVRCCYGSQQH